MKTKGREGGGTSQSKKTTYVFGGGRRTLTASLVSFSASDSPFATHCLSSFGSRLTRGRVGRDGRRLRGVLGSDFRSR